MPSGFGEPRHRGRLGSKDFDNDNSDHSQDCSLVDLSLDQHDVLCHEGSDCRAKKEERHPDGGLETPSCAESDLFAGIPSCEGVWCRLGPSEGYSDRATESESDAEEG